MFTDKKYKLPPPHPRPILSKPTDKAVNTTEVRKEMRDKSLCLLTHLASVSAVYPAADGL